MNNNPNNQNNQTIEQSAFWCPSLGVGKLPSGFDGVEPAKRTDYEQIIADVFHKCNEAFVNSPVERDARPGYFRIVVVDIADALASVVPAERTGAVREGADRTGAVREGADRTAGGEYRTPDAAMDVVIDNLTPELIKKICERHGLKKRMNYAEYMTVAEGCKLTKFKGTNATRLVAVRKGHEGNADILYEISVDHDNSTAVIERDGEMLYTIKTLGLSHRRALHAAIQVLRAHLQENDGEHRRHRLSRNLRACGILTPAEELKETVKRQKEEA